MWMGSTLESHANGLKWLVICTKCCTEALVLRFARVSVRCLDRRERVGRDFVSSFLPKGNGCSIAFYSGTKEGQVY
jgi:hypothetical protein